MTRMNIGWAVERYVRVLKAYGDFDGRTGRADFWLFSLANLGAGFGLAAIEAAAGIGGSLSGLFGLAVFVPSIAATFRRVHDTGRSAWWLLVFFIPAAGPVAALVLLLWRGQPRTSAPQPMATSIDGPGRSPA